MINIITVNDEIEEEENYPLGSIWLNDGEAYMLSATPKISVATLISLSSGAYWGQHRVNNFDKITKKEFKKITGHDLYKFKRIYSVTIENKDN